MPVQKVGKNCYQWGNQKVYCGKDAKRKAILQGIAIENTGWKEAEDARDFAREKHEGQMYGDKPYMTHVEDVASGFEDSHLREIAYLHDVVEDSDVTIQEIRERFGEKVSVAVDALTRRKEPYFDYIRRVKENPEATQIKLADLHANLKNNPTESLAKRYHKAIAILTNNKKAEEIDVKTTSYSFILPSEFDENNDFHVGGGYLLISTDKEGKWRIWDMDIASFVGWNVLSSPLYREYNPKYPLTKPRIYQFDSLEDAEKQAAWEELETMLAVENWWDGKKATNNIALGLVSKGKLAALRMKMTKGEKEDAKDPNRSQDWIPNRLVKELGGELKEKLPCPVCGEKLFTSLLAAQRHHFYCEKYGRQPTNRLFFSPLELLMIDYEKDTKQAEFSETPILLISGIALLLGFTIPYFLDSRANKV